jgi:integrase/recombinase XerD
MPRRRGAPIQELSFADWPEADRHLWEAAFRATDDPFDRAGCAAHLAAATRHSMRSSYGIFLGFLARTRPDLLLLPPAVRLDRSLGESYIARRQVTCGDAALASDLHRLRLVFHYLCPGVDCSWLLAIAKRIGARARQSPSRLPLVSIDQLYALGIELMDSAEQSGRNRKCDALQYRDGLIIALLAMRPLRRRTLAALRLGENLIKSGKLWELDIAPQDTKTGRSLEYPLSAELSERIDVYLEKFRPKIPRSAAHNGLWASNLGCPMRGNGIYEAVRRRTRQAFGFAVYLHRFRHAAATFWSIRDPKNVRGAKDLLGHVSFGTTEKPYIMAQSRLAGRALAGVLASVRK